ncbi:Tyrosine kinase-like (TKL) protein [Besnoitia besnoiti]|uniref:Tyrosine kinase-like (TKL) protein n=1 Tax=Besnoitia besnoiti TaxID=94643 RepID=A0A2A9MCR5_BESBE|nr:Tyrosine kinase-like (TKL) protein [Besnoitia besnoiti]PFH35785.1 Tyrosine kinase-like (TKL) protein [Besnoitia besnoiti]
MLAGGDAANGSGEPILVLLNPQTGQTAAPAPSFPAAARGPAPYPVFPPAFTSPAARLSPTRSRRVSKAAFVPSSSPLRASAAPPSAPEAFAAPPWRRAREAPAAKQGQDVWIFYHQPRRHVAEAEASLLPASSLAHSPPSLSGAAYSFPLTERACAAERSRGEDESPSCRTLVASGSRAPSACSGLPVSAPSSPPSAFSSPCLAAPRASLASSRPSPSLAPASAAAAPPPTARQLLFAHQWRLNLAVLVEAFNVSPLFSPGSDEAPSERLPEEAPARAPRTPRGGSSPRGASPSAGCRDRASASEGTPFAGGREEKKPRGDGGAGGEARTAGVVEGAGRPGEDANWDDAFAERRMKKARKRVAVKYAFLLRDKTEEPEERQEAARKEGADAETLRGREITFVLMEDVEEERARRARERKQTEELRLRLDAWNWEARAQEHRDALQRVQAELDESLHQQQIALAETQGCTYRLPKLLWRALAEAKEYERLFQSFSLEEANKLYGRRDVFADWQIENQRLRRAFMAQLQHQQNLILKRVRASPPAPSLASQDEKREHAAAVPPLSRRGQLSPAKRQREIADPSEKENANSSVSPSFAAPTTSPGRGRGRSGEDPEGAKHPEDAALQDQLQTYRHRELRLRRRHARLKRGLHEALRALQSLSTSHSQASSSSGGRRGAPAGGGRGSDVRPARQSGAGEDERKKTERLLLELLGDSEDSGSSSAADPARTDSDSQPPLASSFTSSSASAFSASVAFSPPRELVPSTARRPSGARRPETAAGGRQRSPLGGEEIPKQGLDGNEPDAGIREGNEDAAAVTRRRSGLRADAGSKEDNQGEEERSRLRDSAAGRSPRVLSPSSPSRTGGWDREESDSGSAEKPTRRKTELAPEPADAQRKGRPDTRNERGGNGARFKESSPCASSQEARGGSPASDNNSRPPSATLSPSQKRERDAEEERRCKRRREAEGADERGEVDGSGGHTSRRMSLHAEDRNAEAAGVCDEARLSPRAAQDAFADECEGYRDIRRCTGLEAGAAVAREISERGSEDGRKDESSEKQDEDGTLMLMMMGEDDHRRHRIDSSSSSCPGASSANASRSWTRLSPPPSFPSASFSSSPGGLGETSRLRAAPLALASSSARGLSSFPHLPLASFSASGPLARGACSAASPPEPLEAGEAPSHDGAGTDSARGEEAMEGDARDASRDAEDGSREWTAAEAGRAESLSARREGEVTGDGDAGRESGGASCGSPPRGLELSEEAGNDGQVSNAAMETGRADAFSEADSDTRRAGEFPHGADAGRRRRTGAHDRLDTGALETSNSAGAAGLPGASSASPSLSLRRPSDPGALSEGQPREEEERSHSAPTAGDESSATRHRDYLEDIVQVDQFGKYANILNNWETVMHTPLPEQLLWLDETKPDRTIRPPSQDSYRDGTLFIECLHVESNFFRLLRRCFAACGGGRGRRPLPAERLRAFRAQILEENAELYSMKKQLDASRYRLMKQTKLFLAQANSQFSNFHQLKRGYRLLNLLGKGGFAEVWEVFDPLTCDVLAAKLHVLSSVEKESARWHIVKRVQNEIEIHKDILPHPHIVEMKACFEMGNDVLASILELCEGGDVDHFLKLSGTLPEAHAAEWTRQILEALLYLKRQPVGVIHHLDIKPGNVLLQRGQCKLADFGLSRVAPRAAREEGADSGEESAEEGSEAEGAEDEAGLARGNLQKGRRRGEKRAQPQVFWEGGGTLWYQPPECLIHQRQRQMRRTCQAGDEVRSPPPPAAGLSPAPPKRKSLPEGTSPSASPSPSASGSSSPYAAAQSRATRNVAARLAVAERRGEERARLLALADKDLEAFFRALPLVRYVPLDDKIDIWAVGCILYEMLFNKRPFGPSPAQTSSDPTLALIRDALRGPQFPERQSERSASQKRKSEAFSQVKGDTFSFEAHNGEQSKEPSDLCINLLERLLAYDASQRPTVEEALAHPFFANQMEIRSSTESSANGPEAGACARSFEELELRRRAFQRQQFARAPGNSDAEAAGDAEEEERYLTEGLAERANL